MMAWIAKRQDWDSPLQAGDRHSGLHLFFTIPHHIYRLALPHTVHCPGRRNRIVPDNGPRRSRRNPGGFCVSRVALSDLNRNGRKERKETRDKKPHLRSRTLKADQAGRSK